MLIHIGIDTVSLAGRGFEARVRPGAIVRAGDELIRFDLDIVARGAKSLMTPILVTPMDGLSLAAVPCGRPGVGGRSVVRDRGRCRTGIARTAVACGGARPDDTATSQTLIVTLRQGLHARPAALLAQRAKAFGAQSTLTAHGRSANARSVVAIMALGVRQGDELTDPGQRRRCCAGRGGHC